MTSPETLPLASRTALVTGVSRRKGIGFAIAGELARLGAHLVTHDFAPNDLAQPWGGDDLDAVAAGVRAALRGDARSARVAGADLRDPAQVEATFAAACELTGRVDILVCNHAKSGDDGSILDMTPEALDAFWQANTRSTLLLTRLFATQFRTAGAQTRPGERPRRETPADPATAPKVIWMTSGQQLGPMPGEVAYAASKAALAGVTATVAAELLDLGIVLNTVNPGPVNTGYLDPESTDRPLAELDQLRAQMPFGRWGEPADPARLIGWLVSPAGSWVVGQVLNSDGGFTLR
ncbi:SDR family oxidoreductase [Cellulomonas denverensis]|uniref:SDR family oxidoreductase n=1 Tax=Cellulomonas denverensis TaxID=264297 RepID=UPI0035E868A9